MSRTGRRRVTRRRALIVAFTTFVAACAGVYAARFSLARWGIARALTGAGLAPAAFRVTRVGLGGVRIADLSIGSPTWLSAAQVEVRLTLGALLAGRANAVRIDRAEWIVGVGEEAMDWGFRPARPGGRSKAFDLPCDIIELRSSAVRVRTASAAHEVLLSGSVTRKRGGWLSGQLDATALGRAATLDTTAFVGDTRIAADLQANIRPGTSAPKHVTALARGSLDRTTGEIDANAEITLRSFKELLGGLGVEAEEARITVGASLRAGSLGALAVTAEGRAVRIGDFAIDTFDIRADKMSDATIAFAGTASAAGWELPGAEGEIRWAAPSSEAPGDAPWVVSADVRTGQGIEVSLDAAGITGRVGPLTAAARFGVDRSGVRALDGRLTIEDGAMQAGDLSLTDAHAEAELRGGRTVAVQRLSAVIGDGSVASVEPFAWDIGATSAAARVNLRDLSIGRWLPIISGERATGEGRVSGDVELSVDWSSGALRLDQLSGSLRADPSHGFIQVADAEALGGLLDRQDSRFAQDEALRPVRDKIVAALQDFAFQDLRIDLSRRGDQTSALTYISGFGRHGASPQGLNLTLDLHARDAAVDLAARIAARASLRNAAEHALERFFEDKATEQEDDR